MSLTKTSYSMINGAPVNVLDFGAAADGITDSTTHVQAAINSLNGKGGTVVIPRGVVYTIASLTWVNFVNLLDDTNSEGPSTILNGGNAGGAVNEYKLVSGFHPAYILNVHNDWTLETLGPGQAYSSRASFIYQVNGVDKWQIANDINANNTNDLTFYKLNSSFQNLTFCENGANIYGQMTSGGNWTPDSSHNFRGANTTFENSSGNVSLIIRKHDNTSRKIITLDTSADELYIANTANTEIIFTLTNAGQIRSKRGVSGNAFTTTQRNAISVTVNDIGLMVFDTTLGKPVWLKNNSPQTWVDASGTTV